MWDFIETTLYGAWGGLLYTALYNYFARRADRAGAGRGVPGVRAT